MDEGLHGLHHQLVPLVVHTCLQNVYDQVYFILISMLIIESPIIQKVDIVDSKLRLFKRLKDYSKITQKILQPVPLHSQDQIIYHTLSLYTAIDIIL